MSLTVTKHSDARWVFEGQMTAETIAKSWHELLQDRPKRGSWSLNFDAVTHIASAGLAFLLDCLRYAESHEITIHFSALPESVRQLIKVQGLGPLIYPQMKQ